MPHQVQRRHGDNRSPAECTRLRRSWSEEQILNAVLAETRAAPRAWRLPYDAACRAAAQLAVRFAAGPAGGSLTTADVHAVVEGAYRDACPPGRTVPPDVTGEAAGRLVSRLVTMGVPVAGQPAGTRRWPSQRVNADAAATLAVLTFIAAVGRAVQAYALWRARIIRPVWTIAVPAGRLPAKACLMTSHLASHVIIPGLVLISGIAWTCWPGPWPGWLGWLLAAAVAEKLVNIRFRPAGRK